MQNILKRLPDFLVVTRLTMVVTLLRDQDANTQKRREIPAGFWHCHSVHCSRWFKPSNSVASSTEGGTSVASATIDIQRHSDISGFPTAERACATAKSLIPPWRRCFASVPNIDNGFECLSASDCLRVKHVPSSCCSSAADCMRPAKCTPSLR